MSWATSGTPIGFVAPAAAWTSSSTRPPSMRRACADNPFEAVLTNLLGARNVIEAALDAGVKKVMTLSTAQAVHPVNLSGATQLAAEQLFLDAGVHAGGAPMGVSCVRFGSVAGSPGSVVSLLRRQKDQGCLTLADERMTHFWITRDEAARFVLRSIARMRGGEVFVPKMPTTSLVDLARAIAPDCRVEMAGLRPGEKLHEVLISEDESREAVEREDMYVLPRPPSPGQPRNENEGRPLPEGFRLSIAA
jgi:UDP-N-acetylglucosamine 4,6-dehydratase/5-epimerase